MLVSTCQSSFGPFLRGICLALIALIGVPSDLAAKELELPRVFVDGMVLQRDRENAIWGTANPGTRIVVTLAGASLEAVADQTGAWTIKLPPMPPKTSLALKVFADGELLRVIDNVAIGEVWLCSGQSNMEWPLRSVSNADREVASASDNLLRLMKVDRSSSVSANATLPETARWQLGTPETASDFSAACYFFGKQMRAQLDVPVGLIDASWGGSVARAWISADRLSALGGYSDLLRINQLYQENPSVTESVWANYLSEWWGANDPGSANHKWADPDFDTRSWATIDLPGAWETAGIEALSGFDGVVWFRRSFTLTEEQASQAASLDLGPIDDWDTTWINGNLIGATEGWRTPRRYTISAEGLRVGENTLAVRVLDGGGSGGFLGRSEDMMLTFEDDTTLSLAGQWGFERSKARQRLGAIPERPWDGPHGVSNLFGGMIAPMAPYTIGGVAWYQGESDRGDPAEYARLLPNLVSDWRDHFNDPTLPFVIIQLASFQSYREQPSYSALAEIRDVQRKTALADPYAELVATIDIGDRFDIHPTNKKEVGRRLFLAATRLAFDRSKSGCEQLPSLGEITGGHFEITFPHQCELRIVEASAPLGFQICDAANDCRFAEAVLLNRSSVAVEIPEGFVAASVRYCWADSPICNLYLPSGEPLTPFREELAAKD